MSESERVERFEAAYNRIDKALGEMLKESSDRRRHAFAAKVRIAGNRRRRFSKYVDFLLEVGELRNAIVHNRTDATTYIAVPNLETVEELERIERRLFSPERVIPRFQRPVRILAPDDTLSDAFDAIASQGYTRYPVYDRGECIGLVTANGITRFLAAASERGRIELDTSTIKVERLLDADHRRDAIAFVARDAFVDQVDELFDDTCRLEAVIVTEHGKRDERPLGLICPADIAALQ